ncbi:four helix bundle protein [Brevibacillus borstelensis]|uniref:four helix bundle protein n=1 Tax=Brevibacillus borstelensis TaxID=45462 RepID=UPI00204050F1|nr:four helix bundle protein [Brevibacillus borstelensis]MCM3623675.1 four helix bundle protein [Brevibacillus borstelensis]
MNNFRMVDQLIRCATSIGANIAESNGNYVGRERYHLGIASASANEVRFWVDRAYRKGYIDKITFERLDEKAQEIRRMIAGMLKRLKNEKSA